MMGIGTPISQRMQDRMVHPLVAIGNVAPA
jgi:hypothetical protein